MRISSFAVAATAIQSDRAIGAKAIKAVLSKSDKAYETAEDRLTGMENAANYVLELVAKSRKKGTRVCGSKTDSAEDCLKAWAGRYANRDAPALETGDESAPAPVK